MSNVCKTITADLCLIISFSLCRMRQCACGVHDAFWFVRHKHTHNVHSSNLNFNDLCTYYLVWFFFPISTLCLNVFFFLRLCFFSLSQQRLCIKTILTRGVNVLFLFSREKKTQHVSTGREKQCTLIIKIFSIRIP